MNRSLLRRLWIYQSERFPLLVHGLLIAVFSFSAISYARLCRGARGFISWEIYAAGVFCTVTLFLLVRIFDEHKDAEDDAKYRSELPVPRGLISLKELRLVGYVVLAAQLVVHLLFFPKMLLPFAVVLGYLCLMGVEFFIPDWLRRHQFWYVTSHMFIIPLVDIYASGLDWFLADLKAPTGLLFFFVVSYLNGIVLELGRKMRAPEKESEGVLTYTAMLGISKAVWLWIGVLGLTLFAAIVAAGFAGLGSGTTVFLFAIFAICALPALLFWRNHTQRNAKWIEYASALWTISMYAALGGAPMLFRM
ncbi:MAG: UbiA family prenyltransferase [Bacteroidota bacterium]